MCCVRILRHILRDALYLTDVGLHKVGGTKIENLLQGSGFEGEFHKVLSSSSEDLTASSGKGQARVVQVMLKAPVVSMNGWMAARPGVKV